MAKLYSNVPDKAAGDVFTEQMWDDYLRTNLNNLLVPASCRVFHNAIVSAANSAFTVLPFNSERFDTDGMHSNAVNNSRITFDTAGVYLVGCAIYWATNSTGIRTLRCMLNNTTALVYSEFNAGVSAGPGQVVNTVWSFAQGDYVEFSVFQTSGGALNIAQGAAYSPEAWAVWLGRTG